MKEFCDSPIKIINFMSLGGKLDYRLLHSLSSTTASPRNRKSYFMTITVWTTVHNNTN